MDETFCKKNINPVPFDGIQDKYEVFLTDPLSSANAGL